MTRTPFRHARTLACLCAFGALHPGAALAVSAADEDAALMLEAPQPAAENVEPAAAKSWTLTTELGGLHAVGHNGWPDQDAIRLAAALRGNHALTPAAGLRYAARLDAYDRRLAVVGGNHKRSASLQELYGQFTVSPQASLQLGRINIREGSAYSFNPTDAYRANSVKMFVNPSPLVTRESRQGTWGARGLWTYGSGSLSLTYSPKLSSPHPSRAWGLDNGLTNPAHSVFGVWSHSLSESANAKLMAFKASDGRWQVGSTGSALATQALTLHYEVAHGRMPSLAEPAIGSTAAGMDTRIGTQAALGGTWTTGKWSWTLEHAYNGLAVSDAVFARAALQQPLWAASYLSGAEQLQTLSAKRHWFLYVSRPDLFMPQLDLKAFVRANPDDGGRMAWVELRKKLSAGLDLSYQWLGTQGSRDAMLGVLPARQVHQVAIAMHF